MLLLSVLLGREQSQRERNPLPVGGQPRAAGRKLLLASRFFTVACWLLLMQRLENVLFGPHDCSHAPSDGCPVIPTNGSGEALGILARLGKCPGHSPGGSDHADFHPSRACASAETDRPLPWRRRGGGGPAGHQMPYCYCCYHIV